MNGFWADQSNIHPSAFIVHPWFTGGGVAGFAPGNYGVLGTHC
jgi:hypothetical protein